MKRRSNAASSPFTRDWMQDVYHNDRPLPGERVEELSGAAFAGEYEPVAGVARSAARPGPGRRSTVD